jgi:parallel beta-helix repeat protein
MFLLLLLAEVQFVRLAKANFMPISYSVPKPAFVIKSDGSIYATDNVTVPINKVGDTYFLTEDIFGYTIVVDCDNVTVDGAGYIIQGNGNSTGVFINNRNGVTVQKMQINNFSYGIRILSDIVSLVSGNHILSGNNVTNNFYGIEFISSTGNVLRNNRMDANDFGFIVTYSSYNPYVNEYDPKFFYHDIDDSNTVNGSPIYYWMNQKNRSVPSDAAFIGLINCTDIVVQNCNMLQNGKGIITLVSTKNSTITHNNITKNNGAIYLFESTNNYIFENVLTENNGIGIQLSMSSSNNSICNNTITCNNNGVSIHSSSDNIFSENAVTENEYGFIISSSKSINISNNVIERNSVGISIGRSNAEINISGNMIAENTDWGIKLIDNTRNFIIENVFSKNGKGIYCCVSSYNKIIGNTFTENVGWAIEFEGGLSGGGTNSTIYHNYFIDNNKEVGFQVSMIGIWVGHDILPFPNFWDDGERGNYWSDYTSRYPNATEINGTGIGDTPFYINPNNIDHYPVMKLERIPEFPSHIILTLFIVTTLVCATIRNKIRKKGLE